MKIKGKHLGHGRNRAKRLTYCMAVQYSTSDYINFSSRKYTAKINMKKKTHASLNMLLQGQTDPRLEQKKGSLYALSIKCLSSCEMSFPADGK